MARDVFRDKTSWSPNYGSPDDCLDYANYVSQAMRYGGHTNDRLNYPWQPELSTCINLY